MSTYGKPHLSYEDQLALLQRRGLAVSHLEDAVALLSSVGYYRLSAYVYPYRELLSEEARCCESPTHYRSDAIMPGTTFEQVRALYEIDERLRAACLDALGVIEVGLRTRTTHVLGRRDPFGHVSVDALDRRACDKATRSGRSAFEDWSSRCARLVDDARNEDFIKHVRTKYGEPLPVWVAVETFDFGALARLLSLMRGHDINEIASDLGVRNGQLLVGVVRNLNLVRNISAHHGRLWNRHLTYAFKSYDPNAVAPPLRHVARGRDRKKVYPVLVWIAYLAAQFHPQSTFGMDVRNLALGLAGSTGRSLVDDMGFIPDWSRQSVWQGA